MPTPVDENLVVTPRGPLNARQAAIMTALVRCFVRDQQMPSERMIAEELGFAGRPAVRRQIKGLEAAGLIVFVGAGKHRRIKVVGLSEAIRVDAEGHAKKVVDRAGVRLVEKVTNFPYKRTPGRRA